MALHSSWVGEVRGHTQFECMHHTHARTHTHTHSDIILGHSVTKVLYDHGGNRGDALPSSGCKGAPGGGHMGSGHGHGEGVLVDAKRRGG